ncbi:hypothetical protein F4818DRAFT_440629 [Hypoxylon cercidicola]|nr:hypothetical protein F4818DRAFT_440629 [Hypoxylon cercidicola]
MNQLNLYEAEESRRQSQTLMVFTIVTVIFLPLSFLSSFFALNVTTFPHSGDNLSYELGWILGVILGTTVLFLLMLVIAVPMLRTHATKWTILWTGKLDSGTGRLPENSNQPPVQVPASSPTPNARKAAVGRQSTEEGSSWGNLGLDEADGIDDPGARNLGSTSTLEVTVALLNEEMHGNVFIFGPGDS